MKPLLLTGLVISIATAVTAQLDQIPIRTFTPQSVYQGNPVKPHGHLKLDGDLIWTDDFSNSSNWTVTTISGTFVYGDNATPEISSNTDLGTMTSLTAANGFYSFNGAQYINSSDFSDKQTSITSSTIDLTGFSFIEISFEQRFRKFSAEQTFVELSEDGGSTWTILADVNEEVFSQSTVQNQPVLRTPVSGSFNTMIRFRWFGSGYGWSIDDVRINEGYAYDAHLDEAFALIGNDLKSSVRKIPLNQVQSGLATLSFIAYTDNHGYSSLPVSLHTTSGSYDYTTSEITIPSGQSDSLQILLPQGMVIPAIPGNLALQLALESTQTLQQTADDATTLPLEVTDYIYAFDACDGTSQTMDSTMFVNWQSNTGEQAIGGIYQIFENMSVYSVEIGIAPIPAQDQSTYIGNTFIGKLMIFNAATGEFEYFGETVPHTLSSGEFGTIVSLPFQSNQSQDLNAGDLFLVLASRQDGNPIPVAFSGEVKFKTVFGIDNTDIVLFAQSPFSRTTSAPIVRLNTQSPCSISYTVIVSLYQSPSDENTCTGLLSISANGVPDYTSSIDGVTPVVFQGYHLEENLCPGVHTIETTDNCGNYTSLSFVIASDTNFIFNNPFIDSIAVDSLGNTITNCEIYYNGIDTAFIDSIWANGNQVNVIWNIVDSNGSNFDTSSYTLNNGNGVYYLQLCVFCPNRSLGEYFSVTEAIYFNNGNISIAEIPDPEQILFELFPNPTNQNVTITTDEPGELLLQVTDTQGKLVLEDVFAQEKTVSLETFRSGLYFFRLQSAKGSAVARIVKN